jgi:hypothetical protein
MLVVMNEETVDGCEWMMKQKKAKEMKSFMCSVLMSHYKCKSISRILDESIDLNKPISFHETE